MSTLCQTVVAHSPKDLTQQINSKVFAYMQMMAPMPSKSPAKRPAFMLSVNETDSTSPTSSSTPTSNSGK
ncbi:hypothetical protein Bhyg_00528 [Pseudolycoriella hygida]|uniref:Uncharacterized protein n=1 Tax=Pseudolycoriella hygida TaxID=35572 RepID=A0A9Q0S600_9DIPT|nr:hypothetical protein Bhyg_00528 [Pseudolycoriella hygida]